MSEVCKECLLKQIPTVNEKKIVMSKEQDICEFCGEVKQVVVKIKK